MLSRSHRLTSADDFRQVFRRGKRISTEWGVVVVLPTQNLTSRFGFVVSKAVGSAVVRNRVKRRLREACREIDLTGPACDVVVRALPLAAATPFARFSADIRDAITQRGVAQ